MGFAGTSRRITQDIRAHLAGYPSSPLPRPAVDTSWPRITIVTPSLNQASFLEKTIISIHKQNYPNLEHILIDGGSDDGSLDIIRRYEAVLDYWHSEPDRGQWDAINRGAAKATGRYMTWINSDDILLPGALKAVGSFLRENHDTDIVYGNMVEIDENDTVTKRIYTVDFDIRDFLFEINIIFNQPSTFWSTELFSKLGGVKEIPYSMDFDLFYRMYRTGAKYHRLEKFLAGFRVHPASLTGSGEVRRHRGSAVDGIFKEHFGRERNFLDKTVMKAFYRARRFSIEPRAFFAAIEHRIGQVFRIFGGFTTETRRSRRKD